MVVVWPLFLFLSFDTAQTLGREKGTLPAQLSVACGLGTACISNGGAAGPVQARAGDAT